MNPSTEVEVSIPFFDVDSMHMAWHGHFAKYFELARCQLLDELGHGYSDMRSAGIAWPVVDLRVRYLRPLRFQDRARITATLQRWDHQLKITYRIYSLPDNHCVTRGSTLQAPIDMDSGTLHPGQPESVAKAMAAAGYPQGHKA